jgi:hypothetical protein
VAEIFRPNEEKTEDDELVVTGHRDEAHEGVHPDDETAVQTAESDVRSALDALGEDVASSPARRGHEDPVEAERAHSRQVDADGSA